DGAATVTNSAIGTPASMAPEQLTGKDITPAADLFSWASTMVYAATGQAPFGQDTVMAVIHRIMNEPPDLGAMEEPLRGIVAACLAKEPADRPQTQALLMRLLGEEGLTPTAPGTAIMDQGAAFAGRPAYADTPPTEAMRPAGATSPPGMIPPVGMEDATQPAGAAHKPSTRAAAAVLAGLLVAVAVVALVVWASSRGNDHPSGGDVQTPVPSSAPATSAEPNQPVEPTHRRQSVRPPESSAPEPSTSVPDSPTSTATDPSTSDPGGGTTDPGNGGSAGPVGGGGGGVTQPAVHTT
ncbi:MAG: serine/threonine protein kinase, partial [Actinoallomurus sp.]